MDGLQDPEAAVNNLVDGVRVALTGSSWVSMWLQNHADDLVVGWDEAEDQAALPNELVVRLYSCRC